MPRRRGFHQLLTKIRKVPLSICVPEDIHNALSGIPNKSEIISELLEENLERLLGGDIDTKRKYREEKIKQGLYSLIQKQRDKIESDMNRSLLVYERQARVIHSNLLKEMSNNLKGYRKDLIKEFSKSIESSSNVLIKDTKI